MNSNSIPNDVQQNIAESRVAIVTVRPPATGAHVHFHVAGTQSGVANLNDRAAKIRTAFDTCEPRMKDAQTFAVQRAQLIAPEPLMLPDGLEQSLRWRGAVVAQGEGGAGAQSPLGVEAGGFRGHLGLLLR